MKNLQDLHIFIETARLGSLSACARHLDLSPAVVSAAVKRLEAEIETVLFVRSTRRLRLTSKGEQYLKHCRDAVAILDNAYAGLHDNDAELMGTIRLSASSDLGRNLILPWLDDFIDIHPKVTVQLHMSDSYVDLYGQQIDLALRYGAPKDSSLVALPIVLNNRPILCASKEYLSKIDKGIGIPKMPEDLSQHNCLRLGHDEKYLSEWTFEKEGKTKRVEVDGNRRSKDGDVVRRWAVAGKGIALKSQLDIAGDLKAGRLVEVELDGWQVANYPLYLICPERRLIDPLFNAVKEYLIERVEQVLR
ncbi:LysR family transcriptional regulator [Psychrobacter sp. P11G3]|uniref:LysR family transcriptional regulator n=1 Tax=Psychrobacter sp. P11G3 TaxID=1699623 RepID=UPI00070A323C|nr:LysR family transcriptional regulator [Psychrobacter sp. P11G3]KRG36798.1 LysR family transcriptional regulator [Psychrobacter sp. P11G3]